MSCSIYSLVNPATVYGLEIGTVLVAILAFTAILLYLLSASLSLMLLACIGESLMSSVVAGCRHLLAIVLGSCTHKRKGLMMICIGGRHFGPEAVVGMFGTAADVHWTPLILGCLCYHLSGCLPKSVFVCVNNVYHNLLPVDEFRFLTCVLSFCIQ